MKKFFVEKSTNPSTAERERLARGILGSDKDEKVALVDRWFSDRMMEDFCKEEERRNRRANAARAEIEQDELTAFAEHILSLARPMIPAITTRATLADFVALLKDSRINLNALSPNITELQERVVEHREFIIAMLNLDKEKVYSVLKNGGLPVETVFDKLKCEKCGSADFTTDNQIILCDGKHDPPVGYHCACVGLDHVPSDDWLCKPCVDSGNHLIKSVHGKRTKSGKVEYMVDWVGWHGGQTWQRWDEIPQGSRQLVRDWNKKQTQP